MQKRDFRRREKKGKGIENIFQEVMDENLPNLKETDIRMQEAPSDPSKLNPKRLTERHIIIKMAKIKDEERI